MHALKGLSLPLASYAGGFALAGSPVFSTSARQSFHACCCLCKQKRWLSVFPLQIANEPEVLGVLAEAVPHVTVEAVDFVRLTFVEQLQLISTTDVLVRCDV